MKKDIRIIFVVLVLFSMACGIFDNFQELWLLKNNFSVKTIGTVFSLCAILTVSTIFLCSNIIKKEKLKKFITILLLIKVTILLSLFFLNNSGLDFLIKFLTMFEYVVTIEIFTSIYPLIAIIIKDNKVYAKKDIIYDAAYYIGILLTAFLLGKPIFNLTITYNFYLLASSIITLIACIVIWKLDLSKYQKGSNTKITSNVLKNLIKKLDRDYISFGYLMTVLFNKTSWCILFGLTTIMLVNGFGFTPFLSSNYVIIMGLISVVIGSIVLAKLTLKNDYINISIKFAIRCLLLFLAGFIGSKVLLLIAFIYPKLLSDSYSHVTDAPYINRIDTEDQLAFCNLKEMFKYVGAAIGTYLCGIAISINIQLVFILAGIFCFVELLVRYNILYLLNKEGRKNDR